MIMVAISVLSSCTEKNFIDTGKASGIFNGSMMEYLRAHQQDWDITVEVIDYAGLTDLFDGKDPKYKEITFFGPTKLSILRYMLENKIEKVSDRSKEEWRQMMLKYVIEGKHMKESFTKGGVKEGGDNVSTLGDYTIRVYKQTDSYNTKPEAGAVVLYVQFANRSPYGIASADIEPNNGAVHSLPYGYTFGKL